MALTKASTVICNDITMTAGAASVTSADQDLSGAYEATVRVRITNSGALGVAAQVQIQVSEDTTAGNYMTAQVVKSFDLVSGTVTEMVIPLADTVQHLRIVSGANTSANCILRVVVDKVTAV